MGKYFIPCILLILFLCELIFLCAFSSPIEPAMNEETIIHYHEEIIFEETTEETHSPKKRRPLIKETVIEPTEPIESIYISDDEDSAIILARIVYGESRGIYSITEQACIMWTILNRVDAGSAAGFGDSIRKVALAPNQFAYGNFPTVDDYGRDLLLLAKDVLGRWEAERQGQNDVGRVLPSDYFWYAGDGQHNYFRNGYTYGDIWDYSLPSPYDS